MKFVEREAVVDSSVIIRLARLNYLDFLYKIFKKVYITEEVKEEVLKEDKPEFGKIKEFVDKAELIKIDKSSFEKIQKIIKLDKGELTCLYFAKCKNIVMLTDDWDAMIFAREFLEVESYGTLRLIIVFFENGLISKEEAEDKIKNVREYTNLWVEDKIIEEAIKLLK